MYDISLNNAAGELDSTTALTPEAAAEAAIAMIAAAGALHDGDRITVKYVDEN